MDSRNIKLIFALLVSVVAAAFFFQDALSFILSSWKQPEYSYGYLVPPIAILLFVNRLNGRNLDHRGSWGGVVLVVLSIVLELICELTNIRGIQPYAVLLFIYGTFVALFGWRQLFVFAAPLAYLIFAIPLPRFIFASISVHLQLISTDLGAALLQILGYSVYAEGNVIDLGGFQLQVVEACSGLRYLFPLMSFSVLVAYLIRATLWVRLLVVLSSPPITILMNSLRIAIAGVAVNEWGPAMAEGFIHAFEGWAIFIVCILFLLLELSLLRLIGCKIAFDTSPLSVLRRPHCVVTVRSWTRAIAVGILLTLAVGASVALTLSPPDRPGPVLLQHRLADFPTRIGSWRGTRQTVAADIIEMLQLDEYALIDFANESGERINLHIAYYGHQDSTAAYHSPSICIPSGGWKIESFTRRMITVNGAVFPVNLVQIWNGNARNLLYYWFDEHGDILTEDYAVKLHILRNALHLRPTNGALIRVLTPLATGETVEAAEARLGRFLDEADPALRGALAEAHDSASARGH